MGTDTKIDTKPAIFFDGVCNLCNGAVQFIIKRDPNAKFTFASLQSPTAMDILKDHNIKAEELESIVLFENDKVYNKSEAVLRIGAQLSFPWPVVSVFRIIPRGLRDAIYDWIARNRYSWFGKRNECMIPTSDLATRFLD